jgi:hypothetical protein
MHTARFGMHSVAIQCTDISPRPWQSGHQVNNIVCGRCASCVYQSAFVFDMDINITSLSFCCVHFMMSVCIYFVFDSDFE